jgi:pyruvate,orthophosphate dikinase
VYESLDHGGRLDVQILVPFVAGPEEIQKARPNLKVILAALPKAHENPVTVDLGSQISAPSTVLTADKLAPQTEYLTFNTHDLRATAFAYSQEQIEAEFLTLYRD